jgi:sulfite reductase (NADPH) flavoprotein alpha-component
VHGWNDEHEVLEFCKWYGVDPNRLITIPVPNIEGRMHTRTVFQALQQQIDLFGRPPKSFYTDLAAHATTSLDKHALLFIGSPEGGATFKKMAEKDTVNFAEVLMLYPSAKPGIETLCELIGDTKPRHYSIASAQSVVGNRVDLLVVTVDWLTPSGKYHTISYSIGDDLIICIGSPRYGQCTRYLAGLKVGQKVTVSIKPSVMKVRSLSIITIYFIISDERYGRRH